MAQHAWREIFLNHEHAAAAQTVAESVANGHSILVLDDLATAEECAFLCSEAAAAAAIERERKGLDGLVRRPAVELVGSECVALFDMLLLRQMERVRLAAPLLDTHLYGDVLDTCPTTIFHNPQLVWSEGEPAINVYNAGGCFTPHEDAQSITCLLNVSASDAYAGGGTAFWSLADAGFKRSLAETNPPTLLLAPPIGTALIFGGQVTHAAQPLLGGERVVAVASFSPKDFRGIVRPPRDLALFRAGLGAGAPHPAGSGSGHGRADGPSQLLAPRRPASSHPAEDCTLEDLCEALLGSDRAREGGAPDGRADAGSTQPQPDISEPGEAAPTVIRALSDIGALGAEARDRDSLPSDGDDEGRRSSRSSLGSFPGSESRE